MGKMEYNGWLIGDNLKEIRKEKKLKIDDMSEITGLSVSHLRQVEAGTRRLSINTLFKLMNALDVDSNAILLGNMDGTGAETKAA